MGAGVDRSTPSVPGAPLRHDLGRTPTHVSRLRSMGRQGAEVRARGGTHSKGTEAKH